jgi:hypothetical protein
MDNNTIHRELTDLIKDVVCVAVIGSDEFAGCVNRWVREEPREKQNARN